MIFSGNLTLYRKKRMFFYLYVIEKVEAKLINSHILWKSQKALNISSFKYSYVDNKF